MDQAEGLRNIIKQQNQRIIGQSRVITVTSGKGGVGKSNLSINLALQFRKMGKSVIIFDADFGLANIEVLFGVIPEYNLGDLIYKGMDIKEIVNKGPEDVGFISGGSGISKLVNLENDQIRRLVYKLSELEKMADVIIIDTGAGISQSVLEFVASSPEVILVATPEPTSVTDSYALLKALNSFNGFNKDDTKIHLVANRVAGDNDGQNLFDKLNMVVSRFLNIDLNYLGSIPQDANVPKAVMKQRPVSMEYPNSVSAKAFEDIAGKLMHNDTFISNKSGVGRFFSNFFNHKKSK